MVKLSQILVPTDFSSTASVALEYAKTLSHALGASLHVLHVVPDPLFSAMAAGSYIPPPEFYENLERNGRQALEQVLSDADRRKFRATLQLTLGFPTEQIVNYAKERRIDLIVMGTHGRGFLTRLLLGSVADKVIRMAPCPVMTIHPTEYS